MSDQSMEIVRVSAVDVEDVLESNRALTERTLRMRCLAHLAQVKARLLTETIFEVATRKATLDRLNVSLIDSNANLQRQRDVIAKQRQELAERALELEAFSYSVAHELKGPIRTIEGYSRLAIEDYPDGLDDKGKQPLEVIGRYARHMGRVVEDLLKLSRLTGKEVVNSEINTLAMIEEVREEVLSREVDRTIEWTIGALPDTWGDPTAIQQVFTNLLSNAVVTS